MKSELLREYKDPEQLPVLAASDMYYGQYRNIDGTRMCFIGHLRKAYGIKQGHGVFIPNFSKAMHRWRKHFVQAYMNVTGRSVYVQSFVHDINDTFCHSDQERADVWNEAVRLAGYTEIYEV